MTEERTAGAPVDYDRPTPEQQQDPRDTTPRGNPPVDEDAVRRGEEVLERVKAY
jgi:hypothetical protein